MTSHQAGQLPATVGTERASDCYGYVVDRVSAWLRRIPRPARRLLFVAVSIWLLLAAPPCSPLVDPDNIQDQTTTPTEQLRGGETIRQTFVAHQNGLSAIDLVVARYPDQPANDLILRLRAGEPDAPILSTGRIPSTTAHNERVRFSFPPQPDSNGKTYVLELTTDSILPNALTVWATSEPVYPDGQRYRDGSAVPGALSFRTFYQYDARAFVSDVLALRAPTVAPPLVALALLILPGLALGTLALRGVVLDLAERVGVAVGAGIAFWAVLLWLATLTRVPLDGAATAVVLAVALVAACAPWLRTLLREQRAHTQRCDCQVRPNRRQSSGAGHRDSASNARASIRHSTHAAKSDAATVTLAVFIVGIAALALRLIVIRDLVWPLWVDSVHHTLIAQEIAHLGHVPDDYGPFVPDQPFAYHFGFHTIVALVHWLTGAEMPWLVLVVGQILSGLIVFPVYLLAARFCESRWAGLVAAACVGCLSTMPAYYVSWGRYPQLAGLLILPVAYLALTWASADDLPLGIPQIGRLLFAVLLATGLVLTHPRVTLMLAALVLATLLVQGIGRVASFRQDIGARRSFANRWITAASVASLSVVILAPWLSRLTSSPLGAYLFKGSASPPRPFVLPIYGRYDAALVALAALGIIAGLGRKRVATLTLVLWLAVVWLLANPQALGLPIHLFLSNSSVEIALFLPVALAVAIVASQIEALPKRLGRRVASRLGVAAFVALTLVASGNMLDVVNPGTILHTRSDVAALAWMRENLPSDARILINAARWQADIYAGTDGGYWIPVMAQRSATTPPLLYHDAQPDRVEEIGTLSAAIDSWLGDRAVLAELIQREQVTHIYVGARHGALRPSLLLEQGYPLLYGNGRAWVFDAKPGAAVQARSE